MGEKCSTPASSNSGPSPNPQNREGQGGMSTAAIAGTVAGIVLAVLICCVVLAVIVVCVRLRRRRTQSKYNLHVLYNLIHEALPPLMPLLPALQP